MPADQRDHRRPHTTYTSVQLLSVELRVRTRVQDAVGGPTMGRFQQSWMR